MKYKTTMEDRKELFDLFIEMIDASETLSDSAKSNEEMIYECEDNASKPVYLDIFLKNAEIMREKMSKYKEVYDKVVDCFHKPGLIYMGFHSRLTCLHIEKTRELNNRDEQIKLKATQQNLF